MTAAIEVVSIEARKGGDPMKTTQIKRIVLAALVAILMAGSANVLTGCLVCRDCGPHRYR
jgi:hypothetical protein